jgi:hypothetical protein
MMREVDSKIARWGMFLGFWGILSGLAFFLTWDTFWRHHHVSAVLLELGVAALAASVAEKSKEAIQGHSTAGYAVTSAVVILIVLEFFILAFDGLPNVRTGHLKDMGRRMLTGASSSRPAKVYAFEIRSPQQFRLHLVAANRILSNPNAQERETQRKDWLAAITAPPGSPFDAASQEHREVVADRLLQLQPAERRQLILNGQTGQPELDFALENALNGAIHSVDFYRLTRGEVEDLPPQVEMERLNRQHIEETFPGMIAPLAESDSKEWIDLALGLAPLALVGILLGLAMVQIVAYESANKAITPNTLRGSGFGALAGASAGFFGFFLYVLLVRLAYRFVEGSLLADGWLAAPLKIISTNELNISLDAASHAAMLFVLPGAALGAIVPWLKPPSRFPQFWGLIAFLTAVISVAVSIYSGHPYWWIAGGSLAAILVVRAIRSGQSIDSYWPVNAVLISLFVCAVAIAAQATLGDTLRDLHLFIQKPADPYAQWIESTSRMNTLQTLSESADATTRQLEYSRNTAWKQDYDADMKKVDQDAMDIGQALEVSIIGGLSFWITIAALIAWKRYEGGNHR